jgi:hypothetical protein
VPPEIVKVGSDHYIRELAEFVVSLREYLLSQGIPCGPVERPEGPYQSFRIGRTVNLGLVQALLDRWAAQWP